MSLRVIIADDHALIRQGVQMLLEQNEVATVAVAASGDTLLDQLHQHDCDVLVLDLAMPGNGPDGPALLLQIRARYPMLPVLLFTGTASTALLAHLMRRGVRGAVEKSESMDELVAAVQAVAAGERFVSSHLQQRMLARDIDPQQCPPPLSLRERAVVEQLQGGLALGRIAHLHGRSPKTVSRQKIDAMRKLGVVGDYELHQLLRACPTAAEPVARSQSGAAADTRPLDAPAHYPHDDH